MKSNRRILTTFALIGAISCGLVSTGCPIGENLSINYIVPAGLGGAPGVYNPFGITQAIVNALLGATLPSTTSSTTTTTGGTGASPSVSPAVLGAVTTSP